MAKKQATIYTVSQVNAMIQAVLEDNLPAQMSVSAEISGWKRHTSGHCYFALKDDRGVLPCVMWKGRVGKLKFAPEDGMAVLVRGHVDVYEPGGKYQFYVNSMKPAGLGKLQIAFEEMVRRLRAEGLFEDKHKKPIPAYPMRIGILTSGSGAAIADIADSIYNRWPCAKLFLYPVPVQGAGAAAKIAAGLKYMNARNRQLALDVVIVGRGGGSLEDLWQFNEEVLARAIFASEIPVISAVGHEVDTTIADLVADARASTPTKAGVIAVPDINEVARSITLAQKRLARTMHNRIDLSSGRLETVMASAVFRNPGWMLNTPAQHLDEMSARLSDSAMRIFTALRDKLRAAFENIRRIEPHRLLGTKKLALNALTARVDSAAAGIFGKSKLQLTAIENRLGALDPRSVLNRGYSITTNTRTGRLVTGAGDVEVNDIVSTELAQKDAFQSKVTKVKRADTRGK